jgi:DNA-binding transcriptional MerR regulator
MTLQAPVESPAPTYYTAGDIAKLIGLTPATIRLWAETGHFPPDEITVGGIRLWSEKRVQRLLIARGIKGRGK